MIDGVLHPAFILLAGALPVFADVDPDTWQIDPAKIEAKITSNTVAILPVHIYGMPCDMDPINAIAKKHNLGVVEDACQAWLAEYDGKMCGTLGDLGCFSFQNSKHITSGEGGAITSASSVVEKATPRRSVSIKTSSRSHSSICMCRLAPMPRSGSRMRCCYMFNLHKATLKKRRAIGCREKAAKCRRRPVDGYFAGCPFRPFRNQHAGAGNENETKWVSTF